MSEEDQILARLYQSYPLPCLLADVDPIAVQKLVQWRCIEPANEADYRITVQGYRRLKRRWPSALTDPA